MIIALKILSVLLVLLIVGIIYFTSTDVESEYGSYSDAKQDQLFSRGWLPDFIPNSSFDIKVNNNLDLNLSKGEFHFNKNDYNGFIEKLKICSNKEKLTFFKEHYNCFKYSRDNYIWLFHINKNLGHTVYKLSPLNP